MQTDRYIKVMLTIIAVCLLSLVLGQWIVTSTVRAQAPALTRPFPTVIAGTDFGFRIDGWQVGKPIIGTLLVKVNGQWREVQASPKVTPAVSVPESASR
jgi:hypothetical protein